MGGLSLIGLRCSGRSKIGLIGAPNKLPRLRLSVNGERFLLIMSEISSGLTSDDIEAGGMEGGPGECFLT